jgi:hypothetical protein
MADPGIIRSRDLGTVLIQILTAFTRRVVIRDEEEPRASESSFFILLLIDSGSCGGAPGETLGSWGCFGDGERLITGRWIDAQDCSHWQIRESFPAAACGGPVGREERRLLLLLRRHNRSGPLALASSKKSRILSEATSARVCPKSTRSPRAPNVLHIEEHWTAVHV